jgi:c-di-GMP-binding flagellar brake protein YcgR
MGALPEYLQQLWPVERQLTRYQLSVPLRLVTRGVVAETTCLDVSEGGLAARSRNRLEVGQEAVLEFQLPEHDALLSFKAVVRHCDADRCGFEFLTITPEQRQLILNYGRTLSLKKRPKLLR